MIITCPNCNSKYSIKKELLGEKGKKVKCSDCSYQWFEKIEHSKDVFDEKSQIEKKEEPNDKNEVYTNRLLFSEVKKKNYVKKFIFFAIFLFFLSLFYFKQQYLINLIDKNYLDYLKIVFFQKDEKNSDFNLIINQIEKKITILNNNEKVIKIFGKISNTSNSNSYEIPNLQASLLDKKNNIIKDWNFSVDAKDLGPQESISFETSYIDDAEDIVDIKIEFYNVENE